MKYNIMKKLVYILILFCFLAPAWALDVAGDGSADVSTVVELPDSDTGGDADNEAAVEEEDPEEIMAQIVEALQHKALAGNAEAQTALGVCYLKGEGLDRDYELAMQWFLKAAKQHDSSAEYYIGYMYDEGLGLKRDYVTALEWYEKSAAQNDPKGFNGIGLLYYRGKGIKRDYTTALGYFQRAAGLGYAEGYANLGVMYEKGQGVEKDLATAFQYNCLGAEDGSMLAQYNLSRMYYKGRGVEKDIIMAYKWIYISRLLGNDSDQAMEHMNLVSKWLSSKEFDLAKTQATKWLEEHNVVRRAPLMKIGLF